jgi:hypothetical protein
VILQADCLTLRPQMLLAVPVSTAHIQNLPEAVRVHHFQPVGYIYIWQQLLNPCARTAICS